MATTEIEASDVVKLVLQFLKESSLTRTLQTLQDESQVALNTVDNVDSFLSDVQNGNWDAVMSVVSTLKLPFLLLAEVYEQLILELIEMRELDTARQLLNNTEAMARLREQHNDRFTKLESLASKPYFDPRDAYAQGNGKERRRSAIAEKLRGHVSVVPPSRLLALLGQALKWQQHQGHLPSGQKFDLFAGGAVKRIVEPETYVSAPGPIIKFGTRACNAHARLTPSLHTFISHPPLLLLTGKKSHAECAAFSPDGLHLVSGSVDGFLEVWDFESGKIRMDLPYQANDDFMMHDEPVLALTFSRDSELLASGSRDGHIKVWRVTTGQCVRRFTKAHSEGVTCLAFSSDCTQVVSGSFEAVGRVHGLKSGKSLKELRGHSSYINAIAYAPDGKQSKQNSSAHTALTPLTTHTTPSLHSLQATASSPAPPTAPSRYGT